MDGMCMRIGWQSINEPSIVFGNRKATTIRTQIHDIAVYIPLVPPIPKFLFFFYAQAFSIAKNFVVRFGLFDLLIVACCFVYLLAWLLAQLFDPTFHSSLCLSSLLFSFSHRVLHIVRSFYCSEFLHTSIKEESDFSISLKKNNQTKISHANCN